MSALRFNTGKLKYGLIPTKPLEYLAEVYTRGAHKYTTYRDAEGKEIYGKDISLEDVAKLKLEIVASGADNWRLGQEWLSTMESVERHIQSWKAGEDLDPELRTRHLANAAWGLFSLMEFEKTHPELDNRKHTYLNRKKIGLDIDEVLADFVGGMIRWYPEIYEAPTYWNDAILSRCFEEVKNDHDFWINLEPKCNPRELPFEPHAYITARCVDPQVTQLWLDSRGFPKAPLYSVGAGMSKVEAAKKSGIEIFVDDSVSNFIELNNAGICTYLFDAPHNRRIDVGYKRIYNLKELV